MQALLSVSDKNGIVDFAKGLQKLGYEILSTGGTLKTLSQNSIKATDVSDYTGSEELFAGRVKTLHPKIHGGILYRRDNSSDLQTIKKQNIASIDIVCVNLYPFKAITKKSSDFEEIIENIDIGGPALIRSSAKNFRSVLIITDPTDYTLVLKAIATGSNTIDFRREMMIKAFEHTADYDCFIANYMNKKFHQGFGQKVFIAGTQLFQTRYGENPHQKGAMYEFGDFYQETFKVLKGEASFNNLTDANAAIKIATSFGESPAVCIVKHANPCGFSLKNTALEGYQEALKCDPISAYGGVVAINALVDEELAKLIYETYIEVLIAPTFTPAALKIFENKKRIKIFSCRYPNAKTLGFVRDDFDFKHIEGGFVYQESDTIHYDELADAKLVSQTPSTSALLKDLEIAYKIAALTKSNCVAYVKNGSLVAIGMGMTSRVDASKAALNKAKELGIDVNGAVLASEAFFPFRDSIDMAADAGIVAIIQPGGSIRDDEVIESANEHGIALYFTKIRHFLH